MPLERTTIIPTGDRQQALDLFNNAIDEEDKLVLVVLGDDDTADMVVNEADRVADTVIAGFGRKVVWIKDKMLLEDDIKALEAGAEDISNEDLSGIAAFSLSLDKTVEYIIRDSDDNLEFRVERAFLAAGEA